MSALQVRHCNRVPGGYRGLGAFIRESFSGKAYLFDYYGHELWIPKKVLVEAEGGYWAPKWAVESAKKFAERAR